MDLSLDIHAAFPIGKPCKTMIKKAFICRASQVSMEKGTTNLYKVLAIESENVHVNEIKQAYRRLVLRYHPDVCPPSAAAECARAFMEIQRAYETLSDPVSRKRYDCQMSSAERGYEGGRIFPKQVWMEQLSDLETQSLERVARKRMCF